VLSGLIVVIIALSASTASVSAVAMQEEEPRGTPMSFDSQTLYFYGESNTGTPDTWDAWNHAGSTEPDTDSSFSESNVPGAANYGGGNRVFLFEGSAPVTEKLLINSELPMTGILDLSIFSQTGTANQQVRVTMSVGDKQYVAVTLNEQNKNDDDVYEFSLDSSLKELEIGESISLKVEFTKPGGGGDGYTLFLGRDSFEMSVSVLPPEEVIIPPSQGGIPGEYSSPYANSSNQFSERPVPRAGTVSPIVWGIISLGWIIPAGMFIPNMSIFKPIGIAFLSIGMLVSLSVVPMITNSEGPAEMDLGSVGAAEYTTPDMLASLDATPGEFLAGITPGTSMKLYVTYDRVYTTNIDGVVGKGGQSTPTSTQVIGLGFEDYAEVLADNTTATQRGSERLHLYFSLIDSSVNLQEGHAIIINATFVERCAGCAEVVPQWASYVDEDNLADGSRKGIMAGDGSPRYIIPASAVEVVNVEPTWRGLPLMICAPLAIAAFAFGGWKWKEARDAWLAEHYVEEDFDEDEFDDEDFDEDEFDDEDFDEDEFD
jgi:hypothetical protein